MELSQSAFHATPNRSARLGALLARHAALVRWASAALLLVAAVLLMRTLATAALAVVLFALALWASVRRDAVQQSVEQLLGLPPTVTAVEAYAQRRNGPTFDHSTFWDLL